jgi:hypothetical protein
MSELGWLASRLDRSEEWLWRARRASTGLSEYRRELANVWADNAAREVRTRFLDVHEEDDARCLEQVERQIEHARATLGELERLQEAARAADAASHQVDTAVAESAAEARRAEDDLDQVANAAAACDAAAGEAEALIAQAVV